MGLNPLTFTPPSWLEIDTDTYMRLLNRNAVIIPSAPRNKKLRIT